MFGPVPMIVGHCTSALDTDPRTRLIADGKDLLLIIHLEQGILTSVNYGACDIKPVVAGL